MHAFIRTSVYVCVCAREKESAPVCIVIRRRRNKSAGHAGARASEFLKDVIALLSPNSPPNIHPLCGTSLGIKAYKKQRETRISRRRDFSSCIEIANLQSRRVCDLGQFQPHTLLQMHLCVRMYECVRIIRRARAHREP
jgi:hypothetical protein